MKTIVYVDGFNLYNGCLKFSPYKWLDLKRLSEILLSEHEVTKVKLFTAKVSSSATDPDQSTRQMIYWRALNTVKEIEIIEGEFYEHSVSMPLAPMCNLYKANRITLVRVTKKEEKGTDVNLACHMLVDAFNAQFEQAAVISNDSDLFTPISIIRKQFNLPVALLNPHEQHSKKLKPLASRLARIRESDLAAAQFPDVLTDKIGQFHKPQKWNTAPHSTKTETFCWLKGGTRRLK
jgi:hypothetical protein